MYRPINIKNNENIKSFYKSYSKATSLHELCANVL